ncbi:hypothetical protein FCE95_15930 [Luteimonas gilva]|uniref:Secreted protein n=1 Tax=Luteimonas gilva TaxID=2572684 RepID=A0A4U5JJ72_9GAMM|nr:hypothetical protein [Luteimonas gilva]TKR29612.1 hypothetical protein FCE95_15930 [Luteimonas gilva]
MVRLSLALLLLCACTSVSARNIGLQSPNGESGSCPEVETQAAETPAPKTNAGHTTARTKPAAKPAPAAQGGGGGETAPRSQGPRWHSFLPGMFR